MQPKAYSYVRISSRGQISGDGIRRQIERTRQFASDLHLELDESDEMQDLGVSARGGENLRTGTISAFIENVESGKIAKDSVLIIESLDRFSRLHMEEAAKEFLSLTRLGIRIATVEPKYVYASPLKLADMLLMVMHFDAAHNINELRIGRIRENRAACLANITPGEYIPGINHPAWIGVVAGDDGKRRYVPGKHWETAQLVFQLAHEGMSARAIALYLNENAIEPMPAILPKSKQPDANKRGWYFSYVARMLSSRTAIGEYQPRKLEDGVRVNVGEPIQGHYPSLVTTTMFEAIQAAKRPALGSKAANFPRNKKQQFSNLFSGLARCGHCDGPMSISYDGRTRKFLRCSNAEYKGASKCTNRERYNYPKHERSILEIVAGIDITTANDTARKEIEVTIATLQKSHDKRTKDVNRLIGGFLEDQSAELPQIRLIISKLENEIKTISTELQAARGKLALLSTTTTSEERRAAILSIYDSNLSASESLRRRAQIAKALREVVEVVLFVKGKTCAVVQHGGNCAHHFKDGSFESSNVTSDVDGWYYYYAEEDQIHMAAMALYHLSKRTGIPPEIAARMMRQIETRIVADLDGR